MMIYYGMMNFFFLMLIKLLRFAGIALCPLVVYGYSVIIDYYDLFSLFAEERISTSQTD